MPALAHAAEVPATSSATSSGISGIVRDAKTGEPIENALVLVDCTCLQKRLDAYTNARGLFVVNNLPPGLYTVVIAYGTGSETREVKLDKGKRERLELALTGEVREVDGGKGPVKRSAEPGIKMKGRDLQRLAAGGPGGSATAAVLDMDARGTRDAGGQTTLGHTSAEMDYRVGGASVNDPGLNRPVIQPLIDFVEEVEVRGSGYDAEYGGYVGGVVESRLISGTNATIGSARFSFIPRLAAPRFTLRTDDAVRSREVLDYQMQGALRVGGPIIRDRLFYSVGVSSIGAKSTLVQTFHAREDRDGSGGYEPCPYENGTNDCAAGGNYITTRKFAEQTFPTSAVTAQAFGSLQWAITQRHRLELNTTLAPSFVRRSYRRAVDLDKLDPDFLGTDPSANPVTGGSTVANGVVNGVFGWDRANAVLSNLVYKGRVANDKLEIDASVSFLQSKYVEAWRLDDPSLLHKPATQSFDTQGRSLWKLLGDEGRRDIAPGVDDACNDKDLPGLACPVRSWMSGGIGQYQWNRSRRIGGAASLTHFFSAYGSHQLKYGTQIEHTERKRMLGYSGSNGGDFYDDCNDGESDGGEYCWSRGEGYRFNTGPRVDNHRLVILDLDNPNSRQSLGYGRVRKEEGDLRAIATPLGAGVRASRYEGTVSSQNYTMYLQDRWAVLDNLQLSAGVRWDMQDMRDVLGQRAMFLWDNVAPRASVVYDWTQEGRSRLFASYGWFYQTLPLSLLNRVYGGQINVVRSYRADVCDSTVTLRDPRTGEVDTHHRTVGGQPTEYCTDTDVATTGLTEGTTVPRLRGQYEQQFTIGYDQEVVEDLVLGVSWLHNDLGRAVEDISTNSGQDFIIANPGIPVAGDDMERQQATCERLAAELESMPLDSEGRQPIARELHRCEFLVDAYEKVGELFDRPRRTTDAFSFEVTKRFAKNWMVIGSYTYNRQIGNYDGFVDLVSGAVNLGSSIQYDTPELVRNSFGPLAFSSPHRFKLDGYYAFNLREAGLLTVGAAVRVNSGYPISLHAGSNRHPGQFPIYLLPRGAGGRLDPNYQVNLSIRYDYPIVVQRKRKDGVEKQDTMMLGVGARLYNVTNAKATLRVDEVYTLQNSRPIAGGGLEDLKHAKLQSSSAPSEFFQRDIVQPQGNFGVEAAFQMPLAAQFDLNLLF